MAFIITCEDCIGQPFNFIQHDGEILTKPTGKQVRGILGLQQWEQGSDKLRLTFCDGGNLLGSIWGAFVPWGDPLCHFDFSESELRNGTKSIKCVCWLTIIPPITDTLLCYDFTTGTGRGYIFPDTEKMKMFALEAGITEMETQDHEGKVLMREPI